MQLRNLQDLLTATKVPIPAWKGPHVWDWLSLLLLVQLSTQPVGF